MGKVLFVLEIIGVIAFAISGALAAMKKGADVFGTVFLAVTTALGGGVVRDILLGNLPPVMFVSYPYLLAACLSALAVFADAYYRGKSFEENRSKIVSVTNVFDAVGLAVFTISGMNMAMAQSGNILLILFLGVATGIGGGMLRDMMTGTMARVLRKQVYATASLAGGLIYYLLFAVFKLNEIAAALAGITVIILLRMLATYFKWNLPTANAEK